MNRHLSALSCYAKVHSGATITDAASGHTFRARRFTEVRVMFLAPNRVWWRRDAKWVSGIRHVIVNGIGPGAAVYVSNERFLRPEQLVSDEWVPVAARG